jgi:hypothetical protein
MTPEVAAAIDELRSHFAGKTLRVGEDPHGGACVIIEDVELGPTYTQATSWVGFHITYTCPYADVYPHFLRGDLARRDGQPFGEGISPNHQFPQPSSVAQGTLASRAAVQVSRRSNRKDSSSALETPLIKLLKVMTWTLSR